ncbi:hypothetical protein LTA6_002463 [Microbacterium sp. LTA6]|uniref:hypothetical protein n=1 Tax=Microbacterium sp. LTA6 TaxID=3129771 RepID=UPI00324E30C1
MAEIDDPPRSPAEMLALVDDQQRVVSGRMATFVPWILLSWGVAWLVGFLVLWFDAQQPLASWRPTLPAGLTFAALLLAAGTLSTVFGIRSGRGLRGTRDSAIIGMVYGNLWWLGSFAIMLLGQALLRAGMEESLLSIFYPSAFIFFSGVMYVMSGLIWRAYPMMLLGVWSVVISAVGALLPPPGHYMLYALAGGGAFLVTAAWSARWVIVARRRVAGSGRRS